MRRGGYGRRALPAGRRDYGDGGGRFYGDDGREPDLSRGIWPGPTSSTATSPGYDAGGPSREPTTPRAMASPASTTATTRDRCASMRRPASGGTGGYDYERGYGDGGRGGESRAASEFEDAGRNAGEFLHRAGEKVATWFGGGGEARAYDPDYSTAESAAGPGPQGLQALRRADQRRRPRAADRRSLARRLRDRDRGLGRRGDALRHGPEPRGQAPRRTDRRGDHRRDPRAEQPAPRAEPQARRDDPGANGATRKA